MVGFLLFMVKTTRKFGEKSWGVLFVELNDYVIIVRVAVLKLSVK